MFRDLVDQSKATDELLVSYRDQFSVGRRSLLDLLDAQNTRTTVRLSGHRYGMSVSNNTFRYRDPRK